MQASSDKSDMLLKISVEELPVGDGDLLEGRSQEETLWGDGMSVL